MTGPRPTIDCPCGGVHLEDDFVYEAPPIGETRFASSSPYRRLYRRCGLCGHRFGEHDIDLDGLYGSAYVDATYGERMAETFARIMALPPERSDNAARVVRVVAHVEETGGAGRRLLDVGSGLAVFPARMAEHGWSCVAVDPDPRAARHADRIPGVRGVAADFSTLDPAEIGEVDLVSLNKVLEHVEAPAAFLRRARAALAPGGVVYVEVPDGEAAAVDGPGREEFFIEHHHVFSPASLALLASRAGLRPLRIDSVREASGKYTIFAFLVPDRK